MSDSTVLFQLLWTSDPVGQVALSSILACAVLSIAFIYRPLVARLLRVRELDRKLGSERSRPVGEALDDRRIELDSAFVASMLVVEWAEFQRRWHDAFIPVAEGAPEDAVDSAPVRLLDTLSESLLPRDLRRTMLTCLPGIFSIVTVVGSGISFGIAASVAPGAELGVHVAGAITIALWGITLAGASALATRLLEAAFVRVGESLDQAVERAFACVSPNELATRSVRSQHEVVNMLPGEVTWVAGEIARVLDEGLLRIERSTADAASLVSEEQRSGMRDLVQELSTSVRRGVERHLGALNAALQRTVEHQDQVTGGIAQNYERMVETANAVAPVAQALTEAAGAVTTASASISDSANDVRPALGLLCDTGKALEQATADMGRAQQLSAGSIDDIRSSLIQTAAAVSEQRELVDVGLRETRALVEGLREGLGDELTKSLAEIDQHLTGAVSQLRGVIEDSNRTVAQLGTPLQSAEGITREMHAILERARGDVAGLGEWLSQVIEPVSATLAQIDGRTGEVARVLENFTGQGQIIERSMEALQGSVVEEARELKDASSNLSERLQRATDALASLERSTEDAAGTLAIQSRTVTNHRPSPASTAPAALTDAHDGREARGGFIQRATRIASPERHLAAERTHEERETRRRARRAARAAQAERGVEAERVTQQQQVAEEVRIALAEREAEEARIALAEREAEEVRVASAEREAEEARIALAEREAEEARIAQAECESAEARIAEEHAEEEVRIGACVINEVDVDPPPPVAEIERSPAPGDATIEAPAASSNRLSALIGGGPVAVQAESPTPASLLDQAPDWSGYRHTFRKRSEG